MTVSSSWVKRVCPPCAPDTSRRVLPVRRGRAPLLFDRDGTLVVDVPYCADPALVTPVSTAPAALSLLRAAGIPVGVVSNQSGHRPRAARPRTRSTRSTGGSTTCSARSTSGRCARTARTTAAPAASPHRAWCWPRRDALGVAPGDVAVVGDIGADVGAARAAGARSVLVPTHVTLPEEVDAAPVVRPDLLCRRAVTCSATEAR